MLVAQDEVLVERFVLHIKEWIRSEYRDIDATLVLESIRCDPAPAGLRESQVGPVSDSACLSTLANNSPSSSR